MFQSEADGVARILEQLPRENWELHREETTRNLHKGPFKTWPNTNLFMPRARLCEVQQSRDTRKLGVERRNQSA